MGFFGDLLKVAAPIVGGIVGGPVGAAIGSGVSGYLSKKDQAKQQAAAGNVVQPYLQQGTAAVNQQAALLGVGGDPRASRIAYNNYLKSVGYQGQLESGQRAITTSAAAKGLLGSGSTSKALVRYGDQLGRENFSNYLGQLNNMASMGLGAAPTAYAAATDAANTRASGWDQLLGGVGAAWDAWQNRPSAGTQALDPSQRVTPSGGIQTTVQPRRPVIRKPVQLF